METEHASAFENENLNNIFYGVIRGRVILFKKFIYIKMSIIVEGKNISNNDNAEYVFEPTN